MSAFLLTAVGGTRWETSVALSADSLFAVERLGKQSQRRIVDTSTKSQNQVKSGLLLDIVVAKSSAVLQLLSSENQSLLIRRDSFLILNFGLDIIDSVRWLNIQSDGFTR